MATRVLMVFDFPRAVKPDYDFAEEFADPDGSYTENDVYQALLECGYEVHRLSLYDDVRPLLDAVRDVNPDVIFNLCDTFKNVTHWDKNILATMELLGIPCTGASSSALFLCNDKGLCKKILRFHRVRVPRFHAFYRGHKVWLPKTLKLPCIIKPLTEEASRGISQASIVDDEAGFLARVKMIHERMNLDAIAEEYIDGRELYVSIIGDRALRILPARENDLWADGRRRTTHRDLQGQVGRHLSQALGHQEPFRKDAGTGAAGAHRRCLQARLSRAQPAQLCALRPARDGVRTGLRRRTQRQSLYREGR
jgi:D-alanine-D-alanine ligase